MARVTYRVPQPVQPPDGDPVYTKAQLYRAPNNAGVPGAYTLIATVVGNPSGKYFATVEDDGAASTLDDWYKHRYADTAVAVFSDYSIDLQTDEFLVVLWALADITDEDVDIDLVTQWVNQGITDLWPDIWDPRDDVAIIPWDADDDGHTDEQYDIPAALDEAWRVERVVKRPAVAITDATNATPIVVTSVAHGFVDGDRVYITGVLGNTAANGSWIVADDGTNTFALTGSVGNAAYVSGGTVRKAGTRHLDWMYHGTEWIQQGRRLRVFAPTTGYDYVLHGKHRYRDVSEIGEELFQLLYWMVRQQYLDMRVAQRANTPRFTVLERRSDTTPEQLQKFLLLANAAVSSRMDRLRPSDYVIDIEA